MSPALLVSFEVIPLVSQLQMLADPRLISKLLGLPPDHHSIRDVAPHLKPEIIRKGLDKTQEDLTNAGYSYTEYLFGPEDGF